MKKIAILTLLLALPLALLAQRQSVNINRGWTFSPGWEMKMTAGKAVDLPHTWNYDALAGRPDYYRGLGSYVKVLEVPKEWLGKRVFFRSGGANSVCDLYVNGKHVGQHQGGYTAFGWEITRLLNFGDRNTLWVRVNNSPDVNLPPVTGDFNVYGGLYRDVELVVTPQTYIAMDDHGSRGLYVTPTQVTAEQAGVNVLAVIQGATDATAVTTFILRDREGNTVDSLTRRVKLDETGRSRTGVAFSVANPHLWDGTADPYLYSMEARVSGAGGYDTVRQEFGLRWFSVDESNRFLLNGKPMRIQGVCRVEDWAELGNALRRENHRRDVELLREMGANAVRLAYFPNDPYFLSLCDRAGILVWSEIPLVGPGQYRDKGYTDSEGFWTNSRAQLNEMVHQLYNHPSIVWWGLFDQLSQRGDDPLALVKELNKIAHEEGGGRLTAAASNQDGALNFVTDVIGFNQFMGWTSGLPADFDGWTKDLRKNFATLKSGVSEYGAGGSIYQWTDSLYRPEPDGPWHPEQWQTHFHEKYWEIIASKPYFWGTFVWTMFDYGAAHRTEAPRPGVADFGLVTFDRRVCKDAFYFYKANWNTTDPFVHIADGRWEVRAAAVQTIRAFSNQSDVELFVNGVSMGLRTNDGMGRFVWANVALRRGENKLEVADLMSGERDGAVIVVEPQAALPMSELPGAAAGATSTTPVRTGGYGRR